MKDIIVQFSGGKDSLDSLIWAVKTYGVNRVRAVFCDTEWEHILLYPYIEQTCKSLGVELTIIKGEFSFLELAKKKKRFPSTKARFCTEWLKVRPFIDWLLQQKHHTVIIQGIRADESLSRSKMSPHCTFFKYYKQPYGHDKHGKPKYYTYRKEEVLQYDGLYEPEIERPVFDKTAVEVINSILDNGFKPAPLYYGGAGRVGCFVCIMVTHYELFQMLDNFPEIEQKLIDAEAYVGSLFFPPGYIPNRYCSKSTLNKKGILVYYPTAQDVFAYIRMKNAQGELFPEPNTNKSCMTAFNICE